MGRMWSNSWGAAVPGRTLCLKHESYHKVTITSHVMSNQPTLVHLIMSMESPPYPLQPSGAHTHTHTLMCWSDWARSSGMYVWPAPEGSETRIHKHTSSSVNFISLPKYPSYWTHNKQQQREAGQSLFYQPTVSVSSLFTNSAFVRMGVSKAWSKSSCPIDSPNNGFLSASQWAEYFTSQHLIRLARVYEAFNCKILHTLQILDTKGL